MLIIFDCVINNPPFGENIKPDSRELDFFWTIYEIGYRLSFVSLMIICQEYCHILSRSVAICWGDCVFHVLVQNLA